MSRSYARTLAPTKNTPKITLLEVPSRIESAKRALLSAMSPQQKALFKTFQADREGALDWGRKLSDLEKRDCLFFVGKGGENWKKIEKAESAAVGVPSYVRDPSYPQSVKDLRLTLDMKAAASEASLRGQLSTEQVKLFDAYKRAKMIETGGSFGRPFGRVELIEGALLSTMSPSQRNLFKTFQTDGDEALNWESRLTESERKALERGGSRIRGGFGHFSMLDREPPLVVVGRERHSENGAGSAVLTDLQLKEGFRAASARATPADTVQEIAAGEGCKPLDRGSCAVSSRLTI